MKRILLSAIVLVGSAFGLAAQDEMPAEEASNAGNQYDVTDPANYRYWNFGLELGVSYSLSDLSFNLDPGPGFKEGNTGLDFSFGLSAMRMFTPLWGLRGHYSYLGASGVGTTNNLPTTFEGSTHVLGAEVAANLMNLGTALNRQRDQKLALFITAGASALIHSAELYNGEDRIGNTSGQIGLSIPIGLTAKYSLTNRFDIDLGARYHLMLYDNYDLTQKGGNDAALFAFVGFSYNLGKNNEKRSMAYVNPWSSLYEDMADTKQKITGLTTDDDGDGVTNIMDKDSSTPEGVVVDGSGRPVDSDGDGIPDHIDADPFTAKGARVDGQGREVDSDGDGVVDSQDADPNTPAGKMVNFQGKEIKTNSGGGSSLTGGYPIYFGFNSASVSDKEQRSIAVLASAMQKNADMNIKLIGYSDKVGAEAYNMKLAERRAEAVKRELVNTYGIDASRISTEGKGASEFVASGRNDVNRRVEFVRAD